MKYRAMGKLTLESGCYIEAFHAGHGEYIVACFSVVGFVFLDVGRLAVTDDKLIILEVDVGSRAG